MDIDDLVDAELHRPSRPNYGRKPSHTVKHMFQVLAWMAVDGQPRHTTAEAPRYFGILHEQEAVRFGWEQADKGLSVSVRKVPTLDAMDKYAGLKTTEVWNSAKHWRPEKK